MRFTILLIVTIFLVYNIIHVNNVFNTAMFQDETASENSENDDKSENE